MKCIELVHVASEIQYYRMKTSQASRIGFHRSATVENKIINNLLNLNAFFLCSLLLRSDHLKIHLKTHDNGKPYQCSICNRGYTTAAALTYHMQSHKKGDGVAKDQVRNALLTQICSIILL